MCFVEFLNYFDIGSRIDGFRPAINGGELVLLLLLMMMVMSELRDEVKGGWGQRECE